MLNAVSAKIDGDLPLSRREALWLLTSADLLDTGRLANAIRRRIHPDNLVTFVVDRNVNYTNICESKCKFCAFYRDQDASDAFLLAEEEIRIIGFLKTVITRRLPIPYLMKGIIKILRIKVLYRNTPESLKWLSNLFRYPPILLQFLLKC